MKQELKIPPEFICPISLDIMVEPVVCLDGDTYDKSSLICITNGKCQITNIPMDTSIFIPNLR